MVDKDVFNIIVFNIIEFGEIVCLPSYSTSMWFVTSSFCQSFPVTVGLLFMNLKSEISDLLYLGHSVLLLPWRGCCLCPAGRQDHFLTGYNLWESPCLIRLVVLWRLFCLMVWGDRLQHLLLSLNSVNLLSFSQIFGAKLLTYFLKLYLQYQASGTV